MKNDFFLTQENISDREAMYMGFVDNRMVGGNKGTRGSSDSR